MLWHIYYYITKILNVKMISCFSGKYYGTAAIMRKAPGILAWRFFKDHFIEATVQAGRARRLSIRCGNQEILKMVLTNIIDCNILTYVEISTRCC